MTPRDPFRVPVPGVARPKGSGDVLKAVAEFFGFKKPCGGCRDRQQRMNQTVQFVPPRWPRR